MKRRLREAKLEVWIGFALVICCFLYFQCLVPYHIYFKEQIQLFVFSSGYVLSYFLKPGGLACLAGDFFTQFLYLKGGGAIVITSLLIVEWVLVFRTLRLFSVNRFAFLWALLPVIGEWVIYSDVSFSVALSCAFIIALLAFYVYAHVKNGISIVAGIVLIPALYMLAGGAVFVFLFLALFYDIYNGRKRIIYWLALLVFSIAIPLLLRHFYLLAIKQAYFYPYPGIKQASGLFCLGSLIVLAGFKRFREWNSASLSFTRLLVILLAVWIGGLAAGTDLNREKIVGMATEAYYNHWDKVLNIAGKAKLANPVSTYYTNIALSKQLQLGERMMEFYQPFSSGLFLPAGPESDWFTIFLGSDVYYYIGDMNMAQHSAMLGMIFSPYQRSSRLIQRLAEINIVNGDVPAAMKYIRMLESTLFHRKKAAVFKEMALARSVDDYPWLQNKREMIYKDDIFRNSSNMQASLELLVKNNPANHAALDYLLSFYLLNKNIPAFFNTYSLYCKEKSNYIPKVYAEALLIYFAATENVAGKMMEYHIKPGVIKDFNEYTRLYEDANGSLESVRDRFPNTYWLYYHFATTGK